MDLLPLFLQADGGSDDMTWPLAFIATAFFTCIAVVVTVILWQSFVTYRARMSVARENAYKQLAEDSVRAQERTADRLERTVAELTDLRQRTAELERLLKEVG
jgi:hypothetical protein